MLGLERVTKAYSSRRGTVHALRDICLKIERGSFVTITGPSGSGKTTLLLTIGGLIRPTSGRVEFHGTDLCTLSERHLAAYRNQKIGFVLQSFNLIPYLSAYENTMVPMSLRNGATNNHEQKAKALLDRLGLADRMDHLPRELSVGQQQRVAIARALGNDPEVILADEPTGNLDPTLSAEILSILRDLNEKDGRTVIMVTHSPEAARMGRHHVRLVDGCCVEADGVAATR
jgi:putative ABC transport system ATP-binding protein